jgi:hypothetical protein
MTLRLADGVGATLSEAWISALIVNASAVILAFSIRLAFTSDARCKSVSGIAWWACADWAFTLCSVISWSANGVVSTRIWTAQIFWNEFTAADERIAGHVTWARADWS